MKKISLLSTVFLMVLLCSLTAFSETKQMDYDEPRYCVNGEADKVNIRIAVNPNDVVQISYGGDAKLISRELPLLQKKTNYEVMVNDSGRMFTSNLLNENHKIPNLNAASELNETTHNQKGILDFLKTVHPMPYIPMAGACLAGIVWAIEKIIEKNK